MKIPFKESNKEIINSIKEINLHDVFNIIDYGPKDVDAKKSIETALMLLDVYKDNFKSYEGKFLPEPKSIEYKVKAKKKNAKIY